MNKSGIHIKEKNKGKFTASANRAGMGVQEFARHVLANKDKYSSTQIKRANFARNSKKFKHKNGGNMPDIIRFFNGGGGIPMFQHSGKLGWDNPSAHRIPAYSARNGVFQQDWGEIQTDENGLQYRDVRYNRWNQGSGDQNYSTSIERMYNPNQKGYKKALKKGLIPYMTSSENTSWGETGDRDNYGYTTEQADSLHNRFNEQFGRTVDGSGKLAVDNWETIYNTYYRNHLY